MRNIHGTKSTYPSIKSVLRTHRANRKHSTIVLSLVFLALVLIGITIPTKRAKAEWAIAFSQGVNGAYAWGTAYNKDSEEEAVNQALRYCTQWGGMRCRVIQRGENGCASLATTGMSNNGWGVARRDSDEDARVDAINSCQSANPQHCYIRTAFCDTTAGFEPTPDSDSAFIPPIVAESETAPKRPTGHSVVCRQKADYDACIGPSQRHGEAYCRQMFC